MTWIDLWSCSVSSLILYLAQIGLVPQVNGFPHYILILILLPKDDHILKFEGSNMLMLWL